MPSLAEEATADALVHAVAWDWRTATLSERERALCAFAVKLTREQRAISETDIDVLRTHGFDDRAIHDAVQVIGYFNYITRVADGLHVEPEDFLKPWGHVHAQKQNDEPRAAGHNGPKNPGRE